MSERTSVVIPCYNVQDYLREALDSIQKQTKQVLEVILIDDGSAIPLVLPEGWQGPPLRLLRTVNRGQASARNEAIKHARGEFIAFLDADDFWHPRKIEEQEKALDANPQAVGCFTRCVRAPGFFGFGPYPPADVASDEFLLVLWYHTFFPPSSLLVRRHVLESAGNFEEGLTSGEDVEMYLRLLAVGPILQVPEELTWYRVHAQQFTSNVHRKYKVYKETRRVMISRNAERLVAAGIPRNRLWYAYRENILTVYYRRNFSAARPLLWDYWRDHPADWRILFYAMLTLLPAGLVRSLRGSIATAPAAEGDDGDRWSKTRDVIRRSLNK